MESPPNSFPYDGISALQRWDRAVGELGPSELDPQGTVRFTIDRAAKIASAGSCFALRIAAALRASPHTYLQCEPGGAWLTPEQRVAYNYVPLPARFGNVYTSLQLVQLLRRATGTFVSNEPAWVMGDAFADPFRPRIQPGGFETVALLERDREFHLAAVRRMFAELDVFVFTLGLTEVWCSRADGAAFPMCPGRDAGRFDPERYELRNLGVAENVRYLTDFLHELRALNPRAKVIFSVSPVPIAATMVAPHVARASAYTKSVLRVAAEHVVRTDPESDYFAAFELFSASSADPALYESDRRHISAAGVERAMRMFFRHFLEAEFSGLDAQDGDPAFSFDGAPCDEDLLLNRPQ